MGTLSSLKTNRLTVVTVSRGIESFNSGRVDSIEMEPVNGTDGVQTGVDLLKQIVVHFWQDYYLKNTVIPSTVNFQSVSVDGTAVRPRSPNNCH